MTEPTVPTPPGAEPPAAEPPAAEPPAAETAATPNATAEPPAAEPAATPAGPAPVDPLEAYIAANYHRYSEAAIRQSALAAGNDPRAVDALLDRYRGHPAPPGAGKRAARYLVYGYVAVFAVLTVGMIINSLGLVGGGLGGAALTGIVVLAVTLGVGYGLSMIWVSSRRLGLVIVGGIAALWGLGSLSFGGIGALLLFGAGLVAVVGGILFSNRVGRDVSTSMPVLLSIPLLILLAIGGACVATGFPIPGGGV